MLCLTMNLHCLLHFASHLYLISIIYFDIIKYLLSVMNDTIAKPRLIEPALNTILTGSKTITCCMINIIRYCSIYLCFYCLF